MKKTISDVDKIIVTIANKFAGKGYKEALKVCNKARRALNKELDRRNEKNKLIKKYTIDDFYLPWNSSCLQLP